MMLQPEENPSPSGYPDLDSNLGALDPRIAWQERFDAIATLYDHGCMKDAARFGRRCLVDASSIFGPRSEQVADVLERLGAVYEALGRPERALTLYKLGLGVAEENISIEQLSRLHGKCGDLLVDMNRHADGLAALGRSVTVFADTDRKGSPAHLSALLKHATLSFEAGRLVDAEGGLIDYLALNPHGPGAAGSRLMLAKVYHTAEQPESALEVLDPGISEMRSFMGQDYDPSLLGAALWLKATAHRDLDELDDALEAHSEACQIFDSVYGPQNRRSLLCGCAFAMLHVARNELAEASTTMDSYLPHLEALLDKNDLELAAPLHNGAMLEHQLGVRAMRVCNLLSDLSGDEKILFPAVEQILFKSGLNSELEEARVKLAGQHIIMEDLVEFLESAADRHLDLAEARYLRTAELFRTNLSENHPTLARIYDNLSELYDACRQPAKSLEYNELAEAIRKEHADQLDV